MQPAIPIVEFSPSMELLQFSTPIAALSHRLTLLRPNIHWLHMQYNLHPQTHEVLRTLRRHDLSFLGRSEVLEYRMSPSYHRLG
jgi:hypothetical protein